jgi:hypothetical protein
LEHTELSVSYEPFMLLIFTRIIPGLKDLQILLQYVKTNSKASTHVSLVIGIMVIIDISFGREIIQKSIDRFIKYVSSEESQVLVKYLERDKEYFTPVGSVASEKNREVEEVAGEESEESEESEDSDEEMIAPIQTPTVRISSKRVLTESEVRKKQISAMIQDENLSGAVVEFIENLYTGEKLLEKLSCSSDILMQVVKQMEVPVNVVSRYLSIMMSSKLTVKAPKVYQKISEYWLTSHIIKSRPLLTQLLKELLNCGHNELVLAVNSHVLSYFDRDTVSSVSVSAELKNEVIAKIDSGDSLLIGWKVLLLGIKLGLISSGSLTKSDIQICCKKYIESDGFESVTAGTECIGEILSIHMLPYLQDILATIQKNIKSAIESESETEVVLLLPSKLVKLLCQMENSSVLGEFLLGDIKTVEMILGYILEDTFDEEEELDQLKDILVKGVIKANNLLETLEAIKTNILLKRGVCSMSTKLMLLCGNLIDCATEKEIDIPYEPIMILLLKNILSDINIGDLNKNTPILCPNKWEEVSTWDNYSFAGIIKLFVSFSLKLNLPQLDDFYKKWLLEYQKLQSNESQSASVLCLMVHVFAEVVNQAGEVTAVTLLPILGMEVLIALKSWNSQGSHKKSKKRSQLSCLSLTQLGGVKSLEALLGCADKFDMPSKFVDQMIESVPELAKSVNDEEVVSRLCVQICNQCTDGQRRSLVKGIHSVAMLADSSEVKQVCVNIVTEMWKNLAQAMNVTAQESLALLVECESENVAGLIQAIETVTGEKISEL